MFQAGMTIRDIAARAAATHVLLGASGLPLRMCNGDTLNITAQARPA